MAFGNGPRVVTDGLILALDAADRNSYVSGSTTWRDMSGRGYDFTLFNGVGFNSSNQGSLSLDGIDDYIQRTSTADLKNTITLVIWIKTTRTTSLLVSGTAGVSGGAYYVGAYYPGQGFYNGNAGSPSFFIDTNSVANPAPTYIDDNWHMWEAKGLNFSTWTDVWNFGGYDGYEIGGSIGSILMYNRSLTAVESLQNYNAQKSRFGL